VSERIERLRPSLEEPLLVASAANIRYLVGFSSSNAALVVEPERTLLFSDFRYAEAGRAVEGVEFIETKRLVWADIGEHVSGPVGFEADAITYTQYEALAGAELELVPRRGLVEALRAVKDEHELDAIRAAGAITSQAYERFAEHRFTGRTERELAWWLDSLFIELGAEGPAFETIVAAGPNGARPHARPSDAVVESGQAVVIDAGARVDGYCSDCTRTYATGELSPELADAYATCLAAQLEGLAAVRPGSTGAEADAAARDVIAAAGLGERFGHGLGHGVGLAVHERPTLRPESADVLEPGNVVTVEPGIYLPGAGGVRIEDLVVVTDSGCERLTRTAKEPALVE
jgi:Xaa-Pro aminopeptidase